MREFVPHEAEIAGRFLPYRPAFDGEKGLQGGKFVTVATSSEPLPVQAACLPFSGTKRISTRLLRAAAMRCNIASE